MATIYSRKEMRPRDSFDHYPTPINHCRAGLSLVPPAKVEHILDPGAGTGPWGQAARERYPNSVITGTDLRPLSKPKAYDFWFTGGYNFLGNPAHEVDVFDLIIGNPPYGQFEGRKDALLAEKFCRISLRLLRPGGYMVFLFPVTFIAGQKRAAGLYASHPLRAFCASAERPSFTDDGKTDATEYAFYVWQKGWEGHYEGIPAVFASQFDKPMTPLLKSPITRLPLL